MKDAAEAARPGEAGATSAAAAAGGGGVDDARVESLVFVVAVWPRLDQDQGGPMLLLERRPHQSF